MFVWDLTVEDHRLIEILQLRIAVCMGVHGRPITWDVSVGDYCFLISSDYCSTGLGADLRGVLVRLGCGRFRRHLGPLDGLTVKLHFRCLIILLIVPGRPNPAPGSTVVNASILSTFLAIVFYRRGRWLWLRWSVVVSSALGA